MLSWNWSMLLPPHLTTSLNEEWARLPVALLEQGCEFFGGVGFGAGDAEAGGHFYPVDVGVADVEQAGGDFSHVGDAEPCVFDVEDVVAAVGEDQRGDVEALPGLGPEALVGVGGAAVAEQGEHWAVGAGEGGAGGDRAALADGAAGEAEPAVGRGVLAEGVGHVAAAGVGADDGFLGHRRGDGLDDVARVERAFGGRCFPAFEALRLFLLCAEPFREPFQRVDRIFFDRAEAAERAAVGEQSPRHVLIGEEADRRFGADEHELLDARGCREHLFREVGQAFDRDAPRPAIDPRGKGAVEQPAAGFRGDAAGGFEGGGRGRVVFEQQRAWLAVAEPFGDVADGLFVDFRPDGWRIGFNWAGAFAPGRVGAHDQRGDLPFAAAVAAQAGAERVGPVLGQAGAGGAGFHPARVVSRQRFDVGGQRRVEADVVMRMVADDVDHRRIGAAGVVQVGNAVGQARPEMQQRRRGFAGHPADAVGGAGANALEQGKHRFHPRHAVERLHQMHFGSTGIGDAVLNAAIGQRLDQGLGAVHVESLWWQESIGTLQERYRIVFCAGMVSPPSNPAVFALSTRFRSSASLRAQ